MLYENLHATVWTAIKTKKVSGFNSLRTQNLAGDPQFQLCDYKTQEYSIAVFKIEHVYFDQYAIEEDSEPFPFHVI